MVDDTCSYRRAANSYPPAYPGCHGLRLMSIGLRLGGPQSHYVQYNVKYNNTIIVLYPSLLAVEGVTRDIWRMSIGFWLGCTQSYYV